MTHSGDRRPLVAGNWKMNMDRDGAVALVEQIARGVGESCAEVEVAVCPPFVYLDAVGSAIREQGVPILLGAQDVCTEHDGAFTGAVSASMLVDLGVQSVLAGHSERRHVFGESDALVAQKTRVILDAGLECVLCVGETQEQRDRGQTDEVNRRQITCALAGLDEGMTDRLTIAYEPVWAIGTGKTATPGDAQSAHRAIRSLVEQLKGERIAGRMRIVYGGSVKPGNAPELFAKPDIDGGLIGGASLKAADFLAIAAAATPAPA